MSMCVLRDAVQVSKDFREFILERRHRVRERRIAMIPGKKRARQETHTNFDAHESTRKRTTETQNINHEDSFL